MSVYLLLKTLHILSSTVLFGTGIGIAFFKWSVDRSGSLSAIRINAERVVLADWLFTSTAVVLQPVTGLAMVLMLGYPLHSTWLAASIALYLIAGLCWLPVVWLQLRMRDLARQAEREGTALDARYWRYARCWFWLGVPAFVTLVAVFWLMVAKPML